MFNIRFYNEMGSIDFGGGKSRSLWKVTKADGLALCGRTFTYAKYTGVDGQKIIDTSVNARTITLSGDIFCDRGFACEFDSAMSVLEEKGILEINTSLGKRNINARCCHFAQGDRKGKYMLFTIQFICDDPYFEDPCKTEVAVYQLIPFIHKDFQFPGGFSERISRRNIEYRGTRWTEPVFFIKIDEGTTGDDVLIIKNHTSGESLAFNYSGVLGEVITVDVGKRKIYNQDGESLLQYLDNDCFFGGFRLNPGENDIEVINRNVNTGISVSCCYTNRYSEAVYV